MKKRIVFHLYIGGDPYATELHLMSIAHYSYIFDDAVVVIAYDEEERNRLKDVRKRVAELVDVPRLTIKEQKNSPLREAETFFDEIVNDNYPGITFFCHSKGGTNFSDPECDKEYLTDWILGGYFMSLFFANEAEISLSFSSKEQNAFFFGSFSSVDADGDSSLNAIYSGTFYWVNMPSIRNEFGLTGEEIPTLGSRMYAEEFPGLCTMRLPLAPGSHDGWRMRQGSYDFYGKDKNLRSTYEAICFLCGEEQSLIKKYEKFKREILSECHPR